MKDLNKGNTIMKLYFFKCSVSEDLYGASPNKSGEPLPTPGGGNKWSDISGQFFAIYK